MVPVTWFLHYDLRPVLSTLKAQFFHVWSEKAKLDLKESGCLGCLGCLVSLDSVSGLLLADTACNYRILQISSLERELSP